MIIEKELTALKSLIDEVNVYAHFLNKQVCLENEQNSIQLNNAIDNSETIDCPRIFILTDFLNDRIRIIGGNVSYLLALNNLKIISTNPLNREEQFSEYWYTNIVEKEKLIFIEIESEILIVGKNLEIVKVFQKYFNEYISEISENEILIDSDGVQKILYIN